jgi:predicted anti-sigma-YlaC factor YlaD
MFCWFFRLKISGAMDGDGVLSRAAEKHIRHCANCRGFYNRCILLADGLRGEAAVSNDKISRRLSAHVLRAIPYRQVGVQKVSVRLWPAAVAVCLALVVLVGGLFLARYRNNQVSGGGDLGTEIRVIRNFGGGDLAGVWSGFVERPLASELENLEDDTKSAVRFLVTCVAVNVTGSQMNQQPE